MVALLPYVLKSHKVLILTPSKIISTQLAADFGLKVNEKFAPFLRKSGMFLEDQGLTEFLEPVEVCDLQSVTFNQDKGFHSLGNCKLVISNAQVFAGKSRNSLTSLKSKDKTKQLLEEFDTVIVDEAHHCTAATWKNVIDCFDGKKIVFLTATPFQDNEPLVEILQGTLDKVFEIKREELEGFTIRKCSFEMKQMLHKPFSGLEFFEALRADIEEALARHVGQERRLVKEDAPQAMILVTTQEEAIDTAEGLGPDATYVISTREGDENLKLFDEHKKKIVVVCGMLREGYDNARVTLVVFLRNCKSRVLFEQFCGRCIRMNRTLANALRSEKGTDKAIGTVLTYNCYPHLKVLWEERERAVADESANEENGDDE
ncbi:uncharacterized protein LOC118438857 isoform X1 [Folsomia candida]|nr:uncharacterized protein LOC118438857 isoform X1 [Folsomia candida]XP_035715544.1 uncharacterized protein LOC118438857 isoform X1 [Folsomia candida]XP_035715545.1 uncharacterized protein LOC118438857 isoform X1 [Folsomia candida]